VSSAALATPSVLIRKRISHLVDGGRGCWSNRASGYYDSWSGDGITSRLGVGPTAMKRALFERRRKAFFLDSISFFLVLFVGGAN
jgi:hypothetical protein